MLPMYSPKHSQSSLPMPPDFYINIFLRLSVKSLVRLRCVSKQFLLLIDDPIFAKEHARSRKSQPDSDVIIKYHKALVSLEFHLGEDNQNFANARKLNCPAVIESSERVFLLGCCNGIICFAELETESLILWNPSTGKMRKIDGFVVELPSPCFCYDSVRDEYKVVRMPTCYKPEGLEIYSVKTGSWRKVTEGFPLGWCPVDGVGVFVSGALHWCWGNPNEKSVLAFDLGTETCQLIPLPDNFSGNHKLGVFYQYLCLICNDSVYVLRDHGIADSWTLLISLRSDATVDRLISLPEWRGQVIGTSNSAILWLHEEEDKAQDIDLGGVPISGSITGRSCVCFRSLSTL